MQSFVLLLVLCLSARALAFMPSAAIGSAVRRHTAARQSAAQGLRMAVIEIDSEEALDKTVSSAGTGLVVVDYSTTWCGPCKVIYPKFEELSNKYTNTVFLKVRRGCVPACVTARGH